MQEFLLLFGIFFIYLMCLKKKKTSSNNTVHNKVRNVRSHSVQYGILFLSFIKVTNVKVRIECDNALNKQTMR